MKSRRYRRKSRKMRKSRKIKRGGSPTVPISEEIMYTVYNGAEKNFKPNFAYDDPSILREIFSSDLMQNLRGDDPTYDQLTNTDEFVDPFKIERTRGQETDEVYHGTMTDWDDQKIKDFLLKLQPGDRLNLTIA